MRRSNVGNNDGCAPRKCPEAPGLRFGLRSQAPQCRPWQEAVSAFGHKVALCRKAPMVWWSEGDAIKELARRSSLTFARRGISILQHAPSDGNTKSTVPPS